MLEEASPRGQLKVLYEGPGSSTTTGLLASILWRVRVQRDALEAS